MTRPSERPALVIRPGVSRRLTLLVLVTHGLTLAAIAFLPLPLLGRVGLALAVLLGCALSLTGAVWHLGPWGLRELVWQADGHWCLIQGDGRQREGSLLGSTYVSPALVVLNFRCGRWQYRSLVLMPDNLEPDLLRRLRVRLRLEGVPARKSARLDTGSQPRHL